MIRVIFISTLLLLATLLAFALRSADTNLAPKRIITTENINKGGSPPKGFKPKHFNSV